MNKKILAGLLAVIVIGVLVRQNITVGASTIEGA